ncbi:MAG TPA: DUF4394 domain-containing protein [Blastocatellia bacterium]|nr:DUF4394 domain-containing protein [Blastocatellia bacterium]
MSSYSVLQTTSLFGVRLGQQSASAQALVDPTTAEGLVYAVTTSNKLISFNSVTPGALNSSVTITGLQSGENVLGIDFRPRTGQLFALGSTSRLYTINLATGAATLVGTGAFTPALSGTEFGFDFNPVPDRIRVVSEADQNIRLNPDNGTVAGTDTNLAYATGDPNAAANPNVTAVAYTNNFAGTASTTLFGIDSNLDILVRQGSVGGTPTSPNTGQLTTIGPLGVNTTDLVGFDISTLASDTALASLTTSGATTSSLYTINLATGAATLVGAIGGTETVRDIAIVPRVETIFALTASNRLVSFNSGTPGTLASSVAITGLGAGESLIGLDFRPATGVLYAVSNASRLYTINTTTGATSLVGNTFSPPISGTAIGFDFNPVPDRIRLVTDADQNIRLNPNNGTVAGTDTNLAYATGDPNAAANPNVVASAYNTNSAGVPATTLYGIDSNLDIVVLQGSPSGAPNSPNTGLLTTVGALGVNTTADVGFDIAPQTGAPFASLTPQGATQSSLYTVNLTTGAATLIGTIGASEIIRDIAIQVRVELVYGVTAGNNLISFNSLTPGTVINTVSIGGLQGGENIVGIDFRPATGQLFGVSSASRLYTINPVNGGATLVGPAFTPALTGTAFGVDFNPVPDRIRVVSDADQNLRLNPDTGTVAGTDTNLAYATGDPNAAANPNVVGVAYTNNVAGVTSTTLFGIDSNLDILVRQGSAGGSPTSPNSGQLFTVGPLGVNTGDQVGFDISDSSGTGYASLTATGAATSQFYTVNLLSGAATLVGTIGVSEVVRDISVATNFTPSASAQVGSIAVVNAASFAGEMIAPDEIVAIFGTFQTTNGQPAVPGPGGLPTTLGGITVTINGTPASLLFASNTQVNAVLPAGLADGDAVVTVTSANGVTRSGIIPVTRSAPGLFSARGNGQGTAAALTTFDGITYTPVFNPDGSEREVSPGTAARPNFLILYGTGFRRTTALNPNDGNGVAEAVTATIQGIPATVTYAGAAPGFSGLDQINVVIPPQLAGAGSVKVRLSAGGKPSNTVTIRIGGQTPTVTYQTIIAGQPVTSSLTADDQVQVNSQGQSYFFDAYRFTAAANTSVAISLNSATFDALVGVAKINTDGSLTYISTDDQNGALGNGADENDNALLLAVLPEAGDYAIVVTSAESNPDATGQYSLLLRTGVIQPISYSATPISGTITLTDLQTSAGDFLDAYSFTAAANDTVQIAMSSSAFDAFVILDANNGDLVAFDDNTGGGTNALLTTTLKQAGTYIIIATPFAPGRTGAYTLTVNKLGPAPAEEAVAPEAAPQPGREWKSEEERAVSAHESLSARRIVPRDKQPN